MDILSSSIYGVIQGVTEFLPVSSSGHLAILPYFLHIKDPGVVFDLSMHVGTAASVIVYFRDDVAKILKETIGIIKFDRIKSIERNYTWNMIYSTIATFSLALVLKSFAFNFGRNPLLIAFNLFLFGLLMFVADYLGKNNLEKSMGHPQVKAAVAIGLFQAMAIFPGVSRSGATLTISRFMHLTREEASRYSFLLSVPVIIAGFVYELPKIYNGQVNFDIMLCLSGMAVSFFVGIATIHFFLQVIKKMGLGVFCIYRWILAGIIAYQVL